ncbi:tyrosine-type recombinase/integrase [Micromonospora haikouensis]|uniref:tyrosine-type recombinase/integrase n=1 Tax=Micromonospora haikouensis TaxID=686309 RepID=UPI003799B134
MFTQPNGRPIDPRADHDVWKALMKKANVRDARLHDARHTTATMLLALGVPTRAIMEVMGWSQMATTTRYRHLAPQITAGIFEQVAGLLWKMN